MTTFFWFSIIVVCYAYFGYPLFLYIYSILKENKYKVHNDSLFPSVTLLISAYNEENTIEDKILNSLELNYAKELLEIVVVSDGSNDRTNEIVNKYTDKGVILRHYEGRMGKTNCLNKSIPLAKGDIIVFSDANSIYDKDAVKNLVKNFNNEKIGFVTGHTKYIWKDNNLGSVGIYTRIENLTKKLESKIGSCVGADGAIFAIRKKLYVPLKPYDINDFVIPLNIIQQGFRGIFEENAFCHEKTSLDQQDEFNRQTRITNRTLRAIFSHRELLNPFKYSIFAFELISHKLLKFIVPFFLLSIFILNIAFMLNNQIGIYLLTLLSQVLFYCFGYIGHIRIKAGFLRNLSLYCRTFTVVNIAIMTGWFKYFRGETYTTWNPNR
jgi:cellulose synthase/poly-beta-1,6-N-acetylglucosamine synthase-like glycosyltransferase